MTPDKIAEQLRQDASAYSEGFADGYRLAKKALVTCKDCKHRDPEDKKCDCGHDIRWQLPRHDDWYCADAVRKEE